jgi:transcriptional regulator with XRE-family HTH domain
MARLAFGDKLIRLGLNIAYYRKIKQLTQERLAEIVGVDRSYISKIEAPNMYTSFSLELLCKIADALDVSESKLFEFR